RPTTRAASEDRWLCDPRLSLGVSPFVTRQIVADSPGSMRCLSYPPPHTCEQLSGALTNDAANDAAVPWLVRASGPVEQRGESAGGRQHRAAVVSDARNFVQHVVRRAAVARPHRGDIRMAARPAIGALRPPHAAAVEDRMRRIVVARS